MPSPDTNLTSLWNRFGPKKPKTAGQRRAAAKKRGEAKQRTLERQRAADAIVAHRTLFPDEPSMTTIDRGAIGEARAVAYLKAHGYYIHERNYRCSVGELDIVASIGSTLVFVEVRTRDNARFGKAIEMVTPGKRQQVTRVAQVFVLRERPSVRSMRFDVIAITGGDLEHWIDAWRVGE